MSDDRIQSGVDFDGDFSAYDRAIRNSIALTEQFENQLQSVDRIINGLNSVDIDFSGSGLDQILSQVNDIDDVGVRVNVDDSAIDTAQDKLDDIDSDTATPEIDPDDSGLDTAKRKVDDIDGSTATPQIDPDDSGLDETLREIDELDDKTIQLTFDIGALPDMLRGVFSGALEISGISGIFEMNEALSVLEARTGEIIPGASDIINDVYSGAWGDSREEIAGVIALANQLNVPAEEMGAVVEDAFITAAVTGEDVNAILRTMVNLSRVGLVDSFGEASDVITGGFQDGLNIGDDFLDTLNEYGTTFADAGFEIEDVLGFLNSGLDEGIDNTDRIADSIREFTIKAGEGTEEVAEAYANLGLDEQFALFQEGDLSGVDLMTEAIERLAELDGQLQESTAVALFGTQFEDFSVDTFVKAMDDASEAIVEFDGSTEDAGEALGGSLSASIESFRRTVTTEFGEFLDEQLDIGGRIDTFEEQIGTFLDSLSNGEDVIGALEIAFEIPDLRDTLLSIEQVFASVGIGILQALSSVLRFVGQGDSADSVDTAVRELSEGQFVIELGAELDADELSQSVETAIGRGVREGEIIDTLSDQLDTAQAEGDLGRAYELLQEIETLAGEAMDLELTVNGDGSFSGGVNDGEILANLQESNFGIEDSAEFFGNIVDAQQLSGTIMDQINEAFEIAINTGDVATALDLASILDAEGGTTDNSALASAMQESLTASLDMAINDMDTERAGALLEQLGEFAPPDLVDANQQLNDYLVSIGDSETTISTADEALLELGGTATETTPSIGEVSRTLDEVNTELATLGTEGVGAIGGIRTQLEGLGEMSATEIGLLTQNANDAFLALQQMQDMQIDVNINLTGDGAQYVTNADATTAGGGNASTDVQNDLGAGIP